MNTRLKQFLNAENITQAQFAEKLQVVRASVSHVLSGRNNPSYDFIKALMQHYPLLNMEWLMFGKGRMYKENQDDGSTGIPGNHSALLFDDFTAEDDVHAAKESPSEDKEQDFTQIKTDASYNIPQNTINQRKVSKIIVLFDDGTFQEL